ncbi:MAG: NHL repeat-containing protein [Verrucomicrobia bacterium]|nr:NHL repeat-containing protein [Verrucomicrobiota bacterium]
MKRQILISLLVVALAGLDIARAFGPSNPPPGVDSFSGGPMALDLAHDRMFLCDSANNRVLVYDISAGTLGPAPLAIIGQPDAQSVAMNATGEPTPNGCGLAFPNGIAYDAVRDGLWVSDFLNNRVLFFDTHVLKNLLPADFVIGQSGFGLAEARCGPRGLAGPAGLALSVDGNRLFVADSLNHRVLLFAVEKLAHLPAAVAVVGQEDFLGYEPGTSATALRAPSGVAVDGNNQLYVADTGNNRVVVFDGNAPLTGASAYAVFGQEDFNLAEAAGGAEGLRAPTDITLDEFDSWMFVTDAGNHRIVGYSGRSAEPLRVAAVIGQPDIESCEPQAANAGLDTPTGLVFDLVEQKLWVAESGNARVGFYKFGGN